MTARQAEIDISLQERKKEEKKTFFIKEKKHNFFRFFGFFQHFY
jgi:hypothetical protein